MGAHLRQRVDSRLGAQENPQVKVAFVPQMLTTHRQGKGVQVEMGPQVRWLAVGHVEMGKVESLAID